ncbi:MAG TPA: amidohydrolase [Candidatus Limnocylindrales bacterium]
MNEAADLLITGRIATLAGDRASGPGWVASIAIRDGRVIAAGTVGDLEGLAGPETRRVVLEPGELAVPGLIDAHLHLAEAGLAAARVDLSGATTIDDGLRIVADAAERLAPGGWIQGQGWLADRWGAWPTAVALEGASAGHPAAIWAHDLHAIWANETAIRIAQVDAATPDPAGGTIRRLDDGRPAGVFHETAVRLIFKRVPPATAAEIADSIGPLISELVSLGVTGVQDPGALSPQVGLGPAIDAYRGLAASGRLGIRIHVSVRPEQLDAAIEAGLRSGQPIDGGDDGRRLRFGWLKVFADGTLGSRSASMLEPFEPEPDGTPQPGDGVGLWVTEPERMIELARRAADAGIGTLIHAIGDRAVRVALDALEPVAGRTSPVLPRLEHVQLATDADAGRFGRSGIAASVQPIHLRSDAEAARRLWGDRAERDGYRLRTLLDNGALLAFGTDAPAETLNPWPGIEIAVTRTGDTWSRDAGPFGTQEALTVADALRAATVGPATTAGTPDRGRLVPGSVADVVVIPAAALDEPAEPGGPLGRVRPRLVLLDGDVAFER